MPVIDWLKENGVDQIDVSGRDFIKIYASIGTIEKLLHTRMYNYKHKETGMKNGNFFFCDTLPHHPPTGKTATRAFGDIHVPDHLHIIDMVLGLSELVPKSEIDISKLSTKRAVTQTASQGFVYPGLLRINYYLPSSYWVHYKSSIGVANFQDLAGFSHSDLGVFNANMNESIHVDKIVGRFSGNSPDTQSNAQVQVSFVQLIFNE